MTRIYGKNKQLPVAFTVVVGLFIIQKNTGKTGPGVFLLITLVDYSPGWAASTLEMAGTRVCFLPIPGLKM